ncbi:hypothetical protein [Candidatus Methanoperedens nitratireducens]|uniref:Uncharacterized protein n=1 Tax=Candidatus Methanoperedens nitratireducens TaxID=1392998 RepID=A0A284VNA4_9EURY|nr:hypothetical protein [Candidatus Methanoperedens nitroreducens]SNQ60765.1 hypothetical protein MNV_2010013 [Candidatus Methanoperedens nitroreducens]
MAITNQLLLKQLKTQIGRVEIATLLVELAERAEHNVMLQQILRSIELPPPFGTFEYIKHSNRKGYWRKKPWHREYPTEAQLEARLQFSTINYNLFGIKGTLSRVDGTCIGLVNKLAGDFMRGRKLISKEELEERKKQKTIERIARV